MYAYLPPEAVASALQLVGCMVTAFVAVMSFFLTSRG